MTSLLSGGYQHSTRDLVADRQFEFWHDLICDEFVKLDCERGGQGEFHGQIRGGLSLADLQFSEVIGDPHHVIRSKKQIARSNDSEFLISMQLNDRGIIRQDGREAVLNPGDFALYDATQPYSLTFEKPFQQLVIQIPTDILSTYLKNPQHYTALTMPGDRGLGAVTSHFIRSVAQELDNVEVTSRQLSENLMNMIAMAFSSSAMLKDVYQQSAVKDALLRRVKQFIHINLADPELCVESIAQANGVTPRYLHKLFEQEDLSISRFVLTQRLANCQKMLCDDRYRGHSIEQIAFSQGFNSASHFCRVFKNQCGTTPNDWRRAGSTSAGRES